MEDKETDIEISEELADENAVSSSPALPPDNAQAAQEQVAPKTKKQKFLQFLKFTGFSISAGVIQFLVISTLYDWTGWLPYWGAFPIGLTLSVIWNFTFNRKFTFASAANVPLAMALVVVYNLIIVVPFAVLGEYLTELWGEDYGMLVTVILLLINFITEWFWDKLVVFNDKLIAKLLKVFVRKKPAEIAVAEATKDEKEVISKSE